MRYDHEKAEEALEHLRAVARVLQSTRDEATLRKINGATMRLLLASRRRMQTPTPLSREEVAFAREMFEVTEADLEPAKRRVDLVAAVR